MRHQARYGDSGGDAVKIYVVTRGDDSDYHIVSMWVKEKEANACVLAINGNAEYGDAEIETWELGKGKYCPQWTGEMSKDGASFEVAVGEDSWRKGDSFTTRKGVTRYNFTVRCSTEQKAIKIANERRTQMVADGTWDGMEARLKVEARGIDSWAWIAV